MKSLAHAWRDGEVPPTHRSGPKPPRHWRTRSNPFEATWPRVVTWLESEPDQTAKQLSERLRAEAPSDFTVGQVHTLQRRVKEWRRLAARRLVFAEPLVERGQHAEMRRPSDERCTESARLRADDSSTSQFQTTRMSSAETIGVPEAS